MNMLLDSYDKAPKPGDRMRNVNWPKIPLEIVIHKVDEVRQYVTYSLFEKGELTGGTGKHFKHLFQCYKFVNVEPKQLTEHQHRKALKDSKDRVRKQNIEIRKLKGLLIDHAPARISIDNGLI